MKMTKKLLSVVLAGAMTMSLSTPVLADTGENVYTIPEQGMWINNMEITPLSEMEQAQYSEYELRPVAMAYVNDVEITSSDILSLCNCIDEEIYDTHVVRTYTTDKVREFIKDCKKITSVSSLDNLVYVTYVTNDDYEVVLGYSEDGLEEKCVYNPQEDSAVSITQEEGLLYSNLRYGNQYEMSDATLEYIENCIENDKIEQLRNTVGLSVTMEDGFTFIEEVPVTRVAPPPTNENEVVNTLKSDFPQYGKKEIYSTTGDCTALGKSVSIKVYESRTAYVKKSVNIARYAAGTTLSVIMTAIGVSGAGPVAAILSALNIAYTAATEAGKLQEAVNLCRTAKFSFSGNRRGDVYDTTRYNNYVRVVNLTSSGEFTYGYDAKGNYHWIVSMEPTCYSVASSKIAKDALTNYNWDVANNGYCSQYTPV